MLGLLEIQRIVIFIYAMCEAGSDYKPYSVFGLVLVVAAPMHTATMAINVMPLFG